MTLTQLEYIVAVDAYGHFGKAAAHCFVTQPTLSTQVQKLEEQIGLQLFDRTKSPVTTTEQGRMVIDSAKKMLQERDTLLQAINQQKGIVGGTLKLAVIPTLAPYLLPRFLTQFANAYPGIHLVINEFTTQEILQRLREGKLDAGLLVTPLPDTASLHTETICYEELMAYVGRQSASFKADVLKPKELHPEELMLLEEGHCFRSQIINLCALKKEQRFAGRIEYEAGSLETLRRMVDAEQGMTILPELAADSLPQENKDQLKRFEAPRPVREVSLITPQGFAKKKLAQLLRREIRQRLPAHMLEAGDRHLIYV